MTARHGIWIGWMVRPDPLMSVVWRLSALLTRRHAACFTEKEVHRDGVTHDSH